MLFTFAHNCYVPIFPRLRLVQTAAVTRASAENACVWRKRLQIISFFTQLAASEKKIAACCARVNEPLGYIKMKKQQKMYFVLIKDL